MKWLNELIKHRIVRSYLQRLPKYLMRKHAEQHGTERYYSPKQILDGIKQLKLSERYALYAIAALSNETASKLYAQEMKLNDDILLMRHEVADLYLQGNRDFTLNDINAYAGISELDEPDF